MRMNHRIAISATAAVLLLGGCANMTDTQRRTAIGAGAGALGGAAIGAMTGGKAGTGAVIGAGTLMVCLPLMLAFIVFQKQFLRSFGFSGIK